MNKSLLSFIIPAKNEEDSIPVLYTEILQTLKRIKKPFEIIFIDDGSTDKTFDVMKRIRSKDKHLKIIKLRGNWGKSIALQTGFNIARGNIIITLDADLQDDPSQLPKFLEKIEQGYDLVSGWKKERFDPWHKVIPSRILNFITAKITNTSLHDINCGFKVYRREVVDSLNLYGELYRFIPIIAAKQNFKIGETVVTHRKRKYGKTKFGIERNIKGLLDLITIVFLTGYTKRPGHFFGFFGLIFLACGILINSYITFLRFTTGSIQYHYPLLFLGILLIMVGVQLISTGLIAEMIIYSKNKQDLSSIIEKNI